jgi:hypothetical protein
MAPTLILAFLLGCGPQSGSTSLANGAPALLASVAQATNPDRVNQLKDLKIADVKLAGQTVQAWIMDTESKRQEGMMFLTSKDVKENQGMIFVFPSLQSSQNSFWMHNCPLGLDIIYISDRDRVVNVGDGKPESDAQVVAKADYKWVLEVRRGWAKRHGLKPGDKVKVPPGLSAIA